MNFSQDQLSKLQYSRNALKREMAEEARRDCRKKLNPCPSVARKRISEFEMSRDGVDAIAVVFSDAHVKTWRSDGRETKYDFNSVAESEMRLKNIGFVEAQ